jgi:hypothetical protein
MLKLTAFLIAFFLSTTLFTAEAGVPAASGVASASPATPKLDIGKGGQCIKDPKWMRKNHPQLLKHQREETVRKGIREEKYSLKTCIECHASKQDNRVIGRADSFCEGCHRYEAVKLDCFECHASKRKSATKSPLVKQQLGDVKP